MLTITVVDVNLHSIASTHRSCGKISKFPQLQFFVMMQNIILVVTY